MPARTPPPRRALCMATVLVALAVTSVFAQRPSTSPGPVSPVASESPGPTSADDDDEASQPAESPMEDAGDGTGQGAIAAIPWRTAFTGNLHNKVVHFPLALGLAAALFLIVAPRWPEYEPAARVLLIAGALAAVVAYLSGNAQEGQFEDSPFESVVELHEKFGIATAITLWAGAALAFWPRARRFMPVYGIVLMLLLACTGFLGGVLSHS